MQENELRVILAELYVLEPSLKQHEPELIKLISKFEDIKPDTKFDAAFAARLKAEILSQKRIIETENKKGIFNLDFMNKKIYITAGSLVVISLIIFIYTSGHKNTGNINYIAESNRDNKTVLDKNNSGQAITKLAAGAFGDLSLLNNTAAPVASVGEMGSGIAANSAAHVDKVVAKRNGIMSENKSTLAVAPSVTPGSVSAGQSTKIISGPMRAVGSEKMIVPQVSFKYVYKGEALELKETSSDVYRRLKGNSQTAQELAGLISQANFPDFDIKSFSNLSMTNLSFAENKDKGLMVNLDFVEDNLNISENWDKWKIPERDACGDNQSCWDSFRLKISDVPSDKDAIAMADSFLQAHQINLEHYGAPQVDNTWRDDYNKTEDKTNYYIPEYLSVVYPLQLNGSSVLNQNGSYAGISVSLNLLKKAASGLSGLTPYNYESSSYELETNSDNIIKIAENGGWNHSYFGSAEKVETIELGTPTKSYVQLNKYTDGRNDELLVPALVFPVTKAPDSPYYYGGKFVVVPLVKEMIKDINDQPVPILYKTMGGNTPSVSVPTPATPLIRTMMK